MRPGLDAVSVLALKGIAAMPRGMGERLRAMLAGVMILACFVASGAEAHQAVAQNIRNAGPITVLAGAHNALDAVTHRSAHHNATMPCPDQNGMAGLICCNGDAGPSMSGTHVVSAPPMPRTVVAIGGFALASTRNPEGMRPSPTLPPPRIAR